MTYEQIEARLAHTVGLDTQSMNSLAVPMATEARMRKRGVADVEAYAALLAESETELQNFLEELVVPETWFFRDRQPFLALGQWAANVWAPANPGGVLRLLSMPCSTGEEPFSMVMALLDAGFSPDRFVVEAVDISRVVLERARRGIYGQNSFRGQYLPFRDKYFQKVSEGWQLAEEVQKAVQFRQANVLDPSFCASVGLKDVVFCRNMLIYFAGEAQTRLMATVKQMLSPEGLLFVGYAEAYIFSGFGFDSAKMPMAFCFRKSSKSNKAGSETASTAKGNRALPVSETTRIRTSLVFNAPAREPFCENKLVATPAVPSARIVSPDPETLLKEGQSLADAGCFEAALEKCQAFLEEGGASSRGYCLLGLVSDALGKPEEAEEYYRKALYLDPDHGEALMHLALLAEKDGDSKAALRLRQRALRAHEKLQATDL
jgi:chemotaxis protein methyltransferase WspC